MFFIHNILFLTNLKYTHQTLISKKAWTTLLAKIKFFHQKVQKNCLYQWFMVYINGISD